jgi:light-regulated signal transduction histidine kinase (bacteriophytochrome)
VTSKHPQPVSCGFEDQILKPQATESIFSGPNCRGKIKMENDFSIFEKEGSDLFTSLQKSERSQKDGCKTDQNTRNDPSFFIELISGIQNSLKLIKDYSKISQIKESDNGFSQYFSLVSNEIETIDTVISCFLKYNKLSTPIKKRNTIHNLIEEVLKKNDSRLTEREILIFRRFEDGLPEAIVPDEVLRYILNSVLEYAIALAAPGGGIGFSTRSLGSDDKGEKEPLSPQMKRNYIEIALIFTNNKQIIETFVKTSEMEGRQETKQGLNLILRFVKEIVQRNRGTMDATLDGKKGKTSVLLRFLAEKREVMYYPPEK